jgi:hypothetical protein
MQVSMISWIRNKFFDRPFPCLFYIDDTNLLLYRNALITDIIGSTTTANAILNKHIITLPENLACNKENILQHVTTVCDNLENQMNQLYQIIAKIEFIKKYLVENKFHFADEQLAALSEIINKLFFHKAILFTKKPVQFDRITKLLELHITQMPILNNYLTTLLNSRVIEIAILFSMEYLPGESLSHIRNIVRHEFLKYCLHHTKNPFEYGMWLVLNGLADCREAATILGLVERSLNSKNWLLTSHSLRENIRKTIRTECLPQLKRSTT